MEIEIGVDNGVLDEEVGGGVGRVEINGWEKGLKGIRRDVGVV